MFTKHANNWVFRNIARFINNHKNKVKKGVFWKIRFIFAYIFEGVLCILQNTETSRSPLVSILLPI